MADKAPDLSKLNTVRLLALLKKVRKCQECKECRDCPRKHPPIDLIKIECARREHVAKKK